MMPMNDEQEFDALQAKLEEMRRHGQILDVLGGAATKLAPLLKEMGELGLQIALAALRAELEKRL